LSAKHIILVANTTWNIYNFRLNIIRKFLDEGHSITVVAPVDEYIEYKERFPKVKHIGLRHIDRERNNPFQDFRLIMELRSIYKRLQPDLVIHYTHKPNIYGGIAAKLADVKSIAVVTGLGYAFINNGWLSRVTSSMYRYTHKYHEDIIFENEDDLAYFVKHNLISKDKGIAVNGCGVDTEIYIPFPNGQKKEKITFTFIGRLLYDKGIVEFVEAAKKLSASLDNVEFWVIGELDYGNPSMIEESTLLTWIDEGYITYHGFVKDVKPLIAKSDCIVLPSYREGMPRIILEGMSMAKPVITTRTAGCRQTVVEGENGLLVDVKDSDDLCDAMMTLYNMAYDERHIMGDKGRALAQSKFNSEIIADRLYSIISEI
jgi:glycosyltransferase involved in cell wall biosynthesis